MTDITTIMGFMSAIIMMGATGIYLYVLIKYFRGMKTPPFWVYVFGGFFILIIRDILGYLSMSVQASEVISSGLRLSGCIFLLFGTVELLKSYRLKIKFDKKVKK